jgi:hypothetical protein
MRIIFKPQHGFVLNPGTRRILHGLFNKALGHRKHPKGTPAIVVTVSASTHAGRPVMRRDGDGAYFEGMRVEATYRIGYSGFGLYVRTRSIDGY